MSRTIEPLVSPAWLQVHLEDRGEVRAALAAPPVTAQSAALSTGASGALVVIDIRETRLYDAGHIPGSISIPFSPMSDWAVSDDELLMELPPVDDLFRLLGDWCIDGGTTVALVGTIEPRPAPPYALSDPPRVAATLFYAGVTDVAILDGGFPRWAAEGRPVTVGATAVAAPGCVDVAKWQGTVRGDMFVSTEYVKERLGSAVLLDGREADQYFGVTACPFAGVGGHIPGARSLPAPWMWEEDGTYKPVQTLRAIAEGVAGPDTGQEIILYCGVGGYASAWWFVLSQILGYRSVKIYDGAAEAWVKGEAMVSYTW
jgi:thiosulfate/3-mercaptopyruvate sulfurtransferase